MKYNLKIHELIGLVMIFLAGSLLGFGLYITFWGAIRVLYNNSDLLGAQEFLLFPMCYGWAFVLYELGKIELKEAMPGRRR